MQFFLDTANIEEIEALCPTGLINGVTTNPSLIAKSGGDFKTTIKAITQLIKGPVSAECIALDYETMLKEAYALRQIAENVAIKVPLTPDGLRVCKTLSDEGTMVNVTLCFSAVQALLAAKAGATFISPFVGRYDDIGFDGLSLIEDIVQVYEHYDFKTKILVASTRSALHIAEIAKMGADIATIPPKIFHGLYKHPLTDRGIDSFLQDWSSVDQRIL